MNNRGQIVSRVGKVANGLLALSRALYFIYTDLPNEGMCGLDNEVLDLVDKVSGLADRVLQLKLRAKEEKEEY